MVSSNNLMLKQKQSMDQIPVYGLRKLSMGFGSVLLGTMLYAGTSAPAHADVNTTATAAPDINTTGDNAVTQTNADTSSVTTPVNTTVAAPVTPVENISAQSEVNTADSSFNVANVNGGNNYQVATSTASTVDWSNYQATTNNGSDYQVSFSQPVSGTATLPNLADVQQQYSGAQSATWVNNPQVDTSQVTGVNVSNTDGQQLSLPQDISNTFTKMPNLQHLDLSNIDSSKVTSFDNAFSNLQKLQDVNLGNLQTKQIVSAKNMFANDSELTNVDGLGGMDLTSASSVAGMFKNTPKLQNADLSKVKTSNKLIDTHSMFENSGINQVDLSNWHFNQVKNMSKMFAGTKNLRKVNGLTTNNTDNVENVSGMFDGSGLASVDMNMINGQRVTDMSNMLANMSNLTHVNNMKDFGYRNSAGNHAAVKSMAGLINHDQKLDRLDLTGFKNTNQLTDLHEAFNDTGLASLDLSELNPSRIENMSNMASNNDNLHTVALGKNFDAQSVTNLKEAFANDPELTTFDLSNFKTGDKVENADHMFANDDKLVALTGLDNIKITEHTLSGVNKQAMDNAGSALKGLYSQLNVMDPLSVQLNETATATTTATNHGGVSQNHGGKMFDDHGNVIATPPVQLFQYAIWAANDGSVYVYKYGGETTKYAEDGSEIGTVRVPLSSAAVRIKTSTPIQDGSKVSVNSNGNISIHTPGKGTITYDKNGKAVYAVDEPIAPPVMTRNGFIYRRSTNGGFDVYTKKGDKIGSVSKIGDLPEGTTVVQTHLGPASAVRYVEYSIVDDDWKPGMTDKNGKALNQTVDSWRGYAYDGDKYAETDFGKHLDALKSKGYQLKPGEVYYDKTEGNATVHVVHNTISEPHSQTWKRIVNIVDADTGATIATTEDNTQSSWNALIDVVTGKPGASGFPVGLAIPAISLSDLPANLAQYGYKSVDGLTEIPAMPVDQNTPETTTQTYKFKTNGKDHLGGDTSQGGETTPREGTTRVVFIDDDWKQGMTDANGKALNKEVSSYEVSGNSMQVKKVDVKGHLPKNYQFASRYNSQTGTDQLPDTIVPGADSEIQIHIVHEKGYKQAKAQYNQNIKWVDDVTGTMLHEKSQERHGTWTDYTDLVTGQFAGTNFPDNVSFDAVSTPDDIAKWGYTIDDNQYANGVPAMHISKDTLKDTNITIKCHRAGETPTDPKGDHSSHQDTDKTMTTTISFIDDDYQAGMTDKNGKPLARKLGSYTITGKVTDELPANVPEHVPTGYKLLDRVDYPLTVNPNGKEILVDVKHDIDYQKHEKQQFSQHVSGIDMDSGQELFTFDRGAWATWYDKIDKVTGKNVGNNFPNNVTFKEQAIPDQIVKEGFVSEDAPNNVLPEMKVTKDTPEKSNLVLKFHQKGETPVDPSNPSTDHSNDQVTVKLQFVDLDDRGGHVAKEQSVTTNPGKSIDLQNYYRTLMGGNYVLDPSENDLVNGQLQPYQVGDDASQTVRIYVSHQVHANDEKRTIHRRIYLVDPATKEKKLIEDQTQDSSRQLIKDSVASSLDHYTDWSDITFPEFDLSKYQKIGMTLSPKNVNEYHMTNDDIDKLTADKDGNYAVPDVVISYVTGQITTHVDFVDTDADNTVIGFGEDFSGAPGETVDWTSKLDIPDGYELANGQGKTITLDASQPNVQVKLQHVKHDVSNDPIYDDQSKKTVTRTVTFVDDQGNQLHAPVVQHVNLVRSVMLDDVTGDNQFGPWKLADGNQAQFDAVDPININGYKADKGAAAEKLDINNQPNDSAVAIVYHKTGNGGSTTPTNPDQGGTTPDNPGDHGIDTPTNPDSHGGQTNPDDSHLVDRKTINFVDQDTGETVGSATVVRNLVQTIAAPKGYNLVDANFKIDYSNDQPQTVYVKKNNSGSDDGSTTIIPGGENDKDQVTNKVINFVDSQSGETVGTQTVVNPKKSDKDISLNIPDGYELVNPMYSIDFSNDQPQTLYVTKEHKNSNPDDPNIPVTPTGDKVQATLQFIDSDDGNKVVGDPVTVKAAVGSLIHWRGWMMVPDGYEFKGVPADSMVIKTAGETLSIPLRHKLQDVTNNPQYKQQTRDLPWSVDAFDNNNQLIKHLSQQKIALVRQAMLDLVTNQVRYGNWQPISGGVFTDVELPQIDGYHLANPELKVIAAPEIDAGMLEGDQAPANVSVKYVKDDSTTPSNPGDGDNSGNTDTPTNPDVPNVDPDTPATTDTKVNFVMVDQDDPNDMAVDSAFKEMPSVPVASGEDVANVIKQSQFATLLRAWLKAHPNYILASAGMNDLKQNNDGTYTLSAVVKHKLVTKHNNMNATETIQFVNGHGVALGTPKVITIPVMVTIVQDMVNGKQVSKLVFTGDQNKFAKVDLEQLGQDLFGKQLHITNVITSGGEQLSGVTADNVVIPELTPTANDYAFTIKAIVDDTSHQAGDVQVITWQFVDADDSDHTIGTTTQNARTGESVDLTKAKALQQDLLNKGYVLDGTGVEDLTAGDQGQYVEIKMKHKLEQRLQQSVKGTLLIHFVDQDGKTLMPDENDTKSGNFMGTYDVIAKKFTTTPKHVSVLFKGKDITKDGYHAVLQIDKNTAVNAGALSIYNGQGISGLPNIKVEGNTVTELTIKYLPNDANTVTNIINYVVKGDLAKQQIVGQQKVVGQKGTKQDVTYQVPAGYKVVSGAKGMTVTMDGNPNLEVVVEKDDYHTIDPTIHFVERETGKVLAEESVTNGVPETIDFVFNFSDLVKQGYKLVNPDLASQKIEFANQNLTFDENGIAIVLVTKGANTSDNGQQKPVEIVKTIQFVDSDNQVVGNQKVTGNLGTKQTVNLQLPAGYQSQQKTLVLDFDKTGTISVKVSKGTVQRDITFVVNGTTIVGRQTISGESGKPVTVKLDLPKGYHAIDGNTEATIKMDGTSDFVIPVSQTQSSTTIKFVDESSKQVGTQVVNGPEGVQESVKLALPDGYHAVYAGDSVLVTYGQAGPEVVVSNGQDQTKTEYQKQDGESYDAGTANGDVIASDNGMATGNNVAGSAALSGNNGMTTVSTGVVSAQPVAASVAPGATGMVMNGNVGNQSNVVAGQQQGTQQAALPQTGSKNQLAAVALGLATLSIGFGLLAKKKQA